MLNSPELSKSKIEKQSSKDMSGWAPEKHAIRIQYEFLRRNPYLEKEWPNYSKKFREFFNANQELCISLHASGDEEKINDLCEIIKREMLKG